MRTPAKISTSAPEFTEFKELTAQLMMFETWLIDIMNFTSAT